MMSEVPQQPLHGVIGEVHYNFVPVFEILVLFSINVFTLTTSLLQITANSFCNPPFEFVIMGRPKKASAAAKSRGQNTLSFSSKITKSSAATQRTGKAALSEKPAQKPDVAEVATDSPAATSPNVEEAPPLSPSSHHKLSLRQQPPAENAAPPKPVLSPEQEEALKLPEARIKKYWQGSESARMIPRGMNGSFT